MSLPTKIPSGPLKTVEQHFDFQSGWVRAPIREIVCNKSLTKQARLLWLWLASLKPGAESYTWGDCEAELGCQTKARKNCLGQLVSQGFLEIRADGVVILKDPYVAYKKNLISSEKFVITNDDEMTDHEFSEVIKPKTQPKQQRTTRSSSLNPTSDDCKIALNAWNEFKPDSFQGLNTFTGKHWQALYTQMDNIRHDKKDIRGFIRIVLSGLKKSDWWMNTVNASGRTFKAVFGYGTCGDQKLNNVCNLYDLGSDADAMPVLQRKEKPKLPDDESSTVIMYLNMAKSKGNQKEIDHWQRQLDMLSAISHGDSIDAF